MCYQRTVGGISQRDTLICEKPFAPDDTRICDYYHLTDRYRGPAHSNCNLNYKDSFYISIVFHNLSGYDSHFTIKEIAIAFGGKIVLTKEKYISSTKHVKDITENSDSRNCVNPSFVNVGHSCPGQNCFG